MERSLARGAIGLLAGLALVLVFPSSAKVQRYFGTLWVPALVTGVLLGLWVGFRYITPAVWRRITERTALLLAALTVVVLIVLFALVYPLVNSGVVGEGSDRDEALNVGTGELLHGRYPYRVLAVSGQNTPAPEWDPRGSPISPMPGALLFAVPFFLLGDASYQSFFWLIVFFLTARTCFRDGRLALLSLWALLFLCPVSLHEVMTGGDLLANSLWVFVLTVFLIRCVSRPAAGFGVQLLSAVLFGLGMSSRANFLLIGPLVLSTLIRRAGWKPAVRFMALSALVCAAVTLPFYLYDPAHFTPLRAYGKLARFESILPHAGVVVPALGMLLSAALSFQRMDAKGVVLFRNCAIVLAWPVVWAVVLSSVSVGGLELGKFAWYGLSFVPFGMMACLAPLFERAVGRAPDGFLCCRRPSDAPPGPA